MGFGRVSGAEAEPAWAVLHGRDVWEFVGRLWAHVEMHDLITPDMWNQMLRETARATGPKEGGTDSAEP